MIRCPKCQKNLLQKSEDKLKLRVPILVFDISGQTCVTSCPGCKSEIELPVTLAKGATLDEGIALILSPERLTKA